MRIGIVAQTYGETVGVKTDYMNLIEEFGTPVVIYPTAKHDISTYRLDGLVLPGGTDVQASRYTSLPKWWTNRFCYAPDPYLEYFDTQILPELIGDEFPIFGICRGLQTLNVFFGGSLQMNLPRHPHSILKEDLVHQVLFQNSYGRNGKTNSFHHQGISKLGNGLEILARADDGIIEAIKHEYLPIYAVQWHPERLPGDSWSRSIMKKLFG